MNGYGFFGNYKWKCPNLMMKRTHVSAYRLLLILRNKRKLFGSHYWSPCNCNKLLLKCWFWNKVPNIEEAISRSNIGQFSKLRTFLKSEFCGLRENDQHFYPRCFGSREMAKNKVSKVIVDTLYCWLVS